MKTPKFCPGGLDAPARLPRRLAITGTIGYNSTVFPQLMPHARQREGKGKEGLVPGPLLHVHRKAVPQRFRVNGRFHSAHVVVDVGAEKQLRLFHHVPGADIARHGKHHVARVVMAPDIIAHHVGRHAAQGLFVADDGRFIGRAFQGVGQSLLKQLRHGVVAALLLFRNDHLAFRVQILLPEQRIEGQVTHGGHGVLPLCSGKIGQVGGHVIGSIGVHGAARVFHTLVHAGAAGFGALEDHVLQKMAHSGFLRLFPCGTGLHEKAHRNQRETPVFLDEHGKAVFQAEGLDVGNGKGRPRAAHRQAERQRHSGAESEKLHENLSQSQNQGREPEPHAPATRRKLRRTT